MRLKITVIDRYVMDIDIPDREGMAPQELDEYIAQARRDAMEEPDLRTLDYVFEDRNVHGMCWNDTSYLARRTHTPTQKPAYESSSCSVCLGK